MKIVIFFLFIISIFSRKVKVANKMINEIPLTERNLCHPPLDGKDKGSNRGCKHDKGERFNCPHAPDFKCGTCSRQDANYPEECPDGCYFVADVGVSPCLTKYFIRNSFAQYLYDLGKNENKIPVGKGLKWFLNRFELSKKKVKPIEMWEDYINSSEKHVLLDGPVPAPKPEPEANTKPQAPEVTIPDANIKPQAPTVTIPEANIKPQAPAVTIPEANTKPQAPTVTIPDANTKPQSIPDANTKPQSPAVTIPDAIPEKQVIAPTAEIFSSIKNESGKIVFVIDTSGSMTNYVTQNKKTRLDVVKEKMLEYIQNNPLSSYAIISGNPMHFFPGTQTVCNYSNDYNKIMKHINSLTAEDNKKFYLDNILEALNKCNDADRIEFLTDGGVEFRKINGFEINPDPKLIPKKSIIKFILFILGGTESDEKRTEYLNKTRNFFNSIVNEEKTWTEYGISQ